MHLFQLDPSQNRCMFRPTRSHSRARQVDRCRQVDRRLELEWSLERHIVSHGADLEDQVTCKHSLNNGARISDMSFMVHRTLMALRRHMFCLHAASAHLKSTRTSTGHASTMHPRVKKRDSFWHSSEAAFNLRAQSALEKLTGVNQSQQGQNAKV